jgi:diguanylate cyclase (GGDEF)-like protein
LPTPLRVLLVEPSPEDAALVTSLLQAPAPAVHVDWARSLDDGLHRLRSAQVDVAVIGATRPDDDVVGAVRRVHAAHPNLPQVVLTRGPDQGVGLAVIAAGAQDLLGKEELDPHLLRRSLLHARERTRAALPQRQAAEWAEALLHGLETPACAVGPDGVVLATNSAMSEVTSILTCGRGDDLARLWTQPDAPRDAAVLLTGLREVLGGAARFEHEFRGADGRHWSARITPLPRGAGAVVMKVDITDLKAAESRLAEAALHDPLTGLPNRTLLRDRLVQLLHATRRDSTRVALLFLDVDSLKAVNDSMGHVFGDHLLVAVADRLAAAVRPTDTAARVAGDEFVVAAAVGDEAEARALAERLLALFDEPLAVHGKQLDVGLSVGVAVAQEDDDVEDLVRAADEAMYVAKVAGGHRCAVADPALRARVQRRLQVEQDLQAALAQDRVTVHYQPVVELATGRVVGVEALVRLRTPGGKVVAPHDFMEVAESSGLIVPLGREVLRQACTAAAGWEGDLAQLSVAVNLSARQLAQVDAAETVAAALADSGLDPRRLVLEVTETAVVEDSEAARATLAAVRPSGVRVAIDDFGTGYSSFLYLKRFPVDILKIDRSFIAGMLDNGDDAAIVTSIVRLGRELGVTLVAEGVESEQQRLRLVRSGCEEAQGYYFSPPVPDEELAAAVAACAHAGVVVRHQARGLSVDQALLARMDELRQEGASLHTIAAVLNSEGYRHADGRRWHVRAVARCFELGLVAGQR